MVEAAAQTGDENDRSFGFFQRVLGFLHTENISHVIRFNQLFELALGKTLQRSKRRPRSIQDQKIQPSELLRSGSNQGPYRLFDGNISLDEKCTAAQRANLIAELLCLSLGRAGRLSVIDNNIRSGESESFGNRAAYTTRAPSNQSNLIFENVFDHGSYEPFSISDINPHKCKMADSVETGSPFI